QRHHGLVVFERLGQIHGAAALVALLVEVDGPHPVLLVLKVGRDVDDVVVGAHVAEQAGKAALVKLHKLLGNAHLVEVGPPQPQTDKIVARNTGNMLLDERIAGINQVVHRVGRQQVFQLQPIEARGIGLLHVEVVVVVVELVEDAHPKGPRVAEVAVVDAVGEQVLGKA
nr:hypothetical protein [Tanacetum cinerariifolium]